MIGSVEVISGRYFDSVRLMQVSAEIAKMRGVDAALVAMATDLNRELAAGMGFEGGQLAGVRADDLMIAIRAADDTALDLARSTVDRLLSQTEISTGGIFSPPEPRTIGSAARRVGATVALISVPGPAAFVEAMEALDAGLHVMLFSDNVPISQEVALKRRATESGLLVMGPDCGTSIIGGVGLGFANAVHPGPVGITGASGTGIQQLCCVLDAAGIGVRHALGSGSRDLAREVGAISTVQALEALDADPGVEVILVVSKPPDPHVADTVLQAMAACATPVVPALLGSGTTLEAAARQAASIIGRPVGDLPSWLPEVSTPLRRGRLDGIFSGGTLRDEAQELARVTLGPIDSDPEALGHRMVDYGDDRFTRGRPHPMIDPGLRLEAFDRAVEEDGTGCILCDIVLGHGAHRDPASVFAPLIGAAVDEGIPVIISLCGTDADPQGRDRQAGILARAGAEVYLSNAAAATRAAGLVGGAS